MHVDCTDLLMTTNIKSVALVFRYHKPLDSVFDLCSTSYFKRMEGRSCMYILPWLVAGIHSSSLGIFFESSFGRNAILRWRLLYSAKSVMRRVTRRSCSARRKSSLPPRISLSFVRASKKRTSVITCQSIFTQVDGESNARRRRRENGILHFFLNSIFIFIFVTISVYYSSPRMRWSQTEGIEHHRTTSEPTTYLKLLKAIYTFALLRTLLVAHGRSCQTPPRWSLSQKYRPNDAICNLPWKRTLDLWLWPSLHCSRWSRQLAGLTWKCIKSSRHTWSIWRRWMTISWSMSSSLSRTHYSTSWQRVFSNIPIPMASNRTH